MDLLTLVYGLFIFIWLAVSLSMMFGGLRTMKRSQNTSVEYNKGWLKLHYGLVITVLVVVPLVGGAIWIELQAG